MPSSTNKSLFLQVGADISSLQTQMKAGRTAILALADTAGDVHEEVQKALASFSADPSSLKQLEASYKATFDNIRKTAQANWVTTKILRSRPLSFPTCKEPFNTLIG